MERYVNKEVIFEKADELIKRITEVQDFARHHRIWTECDHDCKQCDCLICPAFFPSLEADHGK